MGGMRDVASPVDVAMVRGQPDMELYMGVRISAE